MRLRILPILIAVTALMLSVKVGAIWQGLSPIAVASTAEAEETAQPAGSDGQSMAGPGMGQGDGPELTGGDALVQADDPFDLSDEEIILLQQLSKRREEIDEQERAIKQRGALLAAAEERIEQKMQELRALQGTIQEMLLQHDEQEEAQMRSLVKIYENMKPKDAARIFEQLDMVVLLEVIDRMKERKAAPILAKMNPAKAKAVTLELAQRRELPIAKN